MHDLHTTTLDLLQRHHRQARPVMDRKAGLYLRRLELWLGEPEGDS